MRQVLWRVTFLNALLAASTALALVSCSQQLKTNNEERSDTEGRPPIVTVGTASFYGASDGFSGKTTANGETYDPNALTAAHRTLPFGTRVRVTNLQNGKQVVVRINDRGPYKNGRIIDLSKRAAGIIGITYNGVARVKLERLS